MLTLVIKNIPFDGGVRGVVIIVVVVVIAARPSLLRRRRGHLFFLVDILAFVLH
jgi:hypothetical protein